MIWSYGISVFSTESVSNFSDMFKSGLTGKLTDLRFRVKMNLKLLIIAMLSLAVCSSYGGKALANKQVENYLLKPSGQYGVSFEDLHLKNMEICPDPNFNGKNTDDFSPHNKNYCHEIFVRIYYPIEKHKIKHISYYKPLIAQLQDRIKQTIPSLSSNQIGLLSEIQSYAARKELAPFKRKFPTIFFSPGLGWPIQVYENSINELVSHGYILVGINSPFVSGDIELLDHHIVKAAMPQSIEEIEKKFISIQARDFAFCIGYFKKCKNLNPLYSNMDLEHIGAFGHSIGGRIIANFVHFAPYKLQAAATLDTAIDPSGKSITRFTIPFMHVISANRIFSSPFPVKFELGKDGYLVVISPSALNHDYSYHMNFTDFSTLQYHPIIKKFIDYLNQSSRAKFDLKILKYPPNKREVFNFKNETYVLIKNSHVWNLAYFKNKKR